jgi:hypothetical protein
MRVKYVLEGCGIAILVLLPYLWPQVSPNHVAIYFSILPIASVSWGILIDFIVLAVFCTLVIAVAACKDRHLVIGRYSWGALVAVVIAAAVSSIAKLAEARRFVPNSAMLASSLVLAAWFVRYWNLAAYQAIVRASRMMLALVGLCAFWMVPELLLIALHRPATDQLAFRKTAIASHAGRRIVWILFDELSYSQAFESRDASLVLPNFDWLRNRSTLFSQLNPAGYYTARVVPVSDRQAGSKLA